MEHKLEESEDVKRTCGRAFQASRSDKGVDGLTSLLVSEDDRRSECLSTSSSSIPSTRSMETAIQSFLVLTSCLVSTW